MTSKAEDLLEAWASFFVAHALAIKQIEENLEAPLSLDEYNLLLGISRAVGGRIRFSALATFTVFTRSGITRITSRLEKRGFLERVECPEDRRGAYAVLTSTGKEALRDTWKRFSKQILAIFDPCFSQSEARQLSALLERLIASLRDRDAPLIQIGS